MARKQKRGPKANREKQAMADGDQGLDALPWRKVATEATDIDDGDANDAEDNMAGMFMLEEIPANSYTLGENGAVVSLNNVIDVVPGADLSGNDHEQASGARKESAQDTEEQADVGAKKPSKRALRRKKMQAKKRRQEQAQETSGSAVEADTKDTSPETETNEGETNKTEKKESDSLSPTLASTSATLLEEESKTQSCQNDQNKNKNKNSKKAQKKDTPMTLEALQRVVGEWLEFGFEEDLLEGIAKCKFSSPTPIQRTCLPKAMQRGMDILGAAETGSGKTLAFGLPILNGLISSPPGPDDGLAALILTPTRELAVQVAKHLRSVIVGRLNHIRVETLVGGMSQAKQERVLALRPPVIVATPGRLWAMIDEGNDHLADLASSLRYLAVDEADRMFDRGHFPDLQPLVKQLAESNSGAKHKRQTFLFSATLMTEGAAVDLQKKLKRKRRGSGGPSVSPLVELMDHIGVRKTALCDLSLVAAPEESTGEDDSKAASTANGKVQLPENLQLCSVECVPKDKDLFLYYFVMEHSGRTLVFVNTISSLRRVAGTLKLLDIDNVTTLHANMQQKLRLRHLERFTKSERGVLVATDVAARGLDIPGIDHVVHYALPKRLDTFVHRSGRTARAARSGVCLSLVDPSEATVFGELTRALGDRAILKFPVRMATLSRMRERVTLARRIQYLENKLQEKADSRKWFRQSAKEADIELDEAIKNGENHLLDVQHSNAKEAASLRNRLADLLEERILGAGVSSKYVSTNSGPDRELVLSGVSRKADAALASAPKEKTKRRRRR
ncbi:ATP-dependent RNA helicase DDX24 [Hondaea fermentalgiana]|uniref:ATP-dependent RNA helicase n=1 Tax=Hondaea fermentalgiana TaxID=2315210 RepID=A0A2R5G0J7_9STRA|nr:ATP-dependent RNA helicase DDX24 [Hondaea fermentalgiana]|eukprot:GBG24556.1 ATP-dependent RNA helicase DDX24 [Hondaea fermentalgiana]